MTQNKLTFWLSLVIVVGAFMIYDNYIEIRENKRSNPSTIGKHL